MGNPFEFTSAQNFWSFLREDGWFWKGYQLPYCDVWSRPLDTTKVTQLSTTPAFESHQHDVPLTFPKDQSKWKARWTNADGQPLQAGDPDQSLTVIVLRTTWVNGKPVHLPGDIDYTVEVPAPKAGYLWVQGNPQPTTQLRGWHDQHARIINPDGSSTEMIGANPTHKAGRTLSVECHGLGRYDPDGKLTDPRDRHVTVWKEETEKGVPATRVSPLMLGRDESPHRLAIVVKGTDTPTSMNEIGLWIALPHDAVPWADLTPDAHRIASMLVNHGAITMDHGGNGGVCEVSGSDWAGLNLGNWIPTFDQFRLVST